MFYSRVYLPFHTRLPTLSTPPTVYLPFHTRLPTLSIPSYSLLTVPYQTTNLVNPLLHSTYHSIPDYQPCQPPPTVYLPFHTRLPTLSTPSYSLPTIPYQTTNLVNPSYSICTSPYQTINPPNPFPTVHLPLHARLVNVC